MMLWFKALHLIFMVTWFAGLFYLPRLYVYHAMSDDQASIDRFKIMERKLYFGIMTPGGVITLILGFWLWFGYGFTGGWLHAKVAPGWYWRIKTYIKGRLHIRSITLFAVGKSYW